MRVKRLVLAAVMGLVLGACNFHATTTLSDAELNREAEVLFQDFLKGDDEAVVARLSPDSDPGEARAQLPMLRRLVEHETAPEPRLEGTRKTASSGGTFYVVAQEYDFPDRTAHMTTEFVKQGDDWKVHAFNINVRMKAADGT
jgi:hypothetical protein